MEVLYSISSILRRSVLVNVTFHVIQFPLMSVFRSKGMKTYLLDSYLFLLFKKINSQKVLKEPLILSV